MLASACVPRPRPVTQFNVETYTRPYQTDFDEVLTIVLDPAIQDDFVVRENLWPMQVHNFRNSLKLSLYYTFEDSFQEVRFQDAPSPEGLSLHIYRIRPSWKIHSIDEHVTGAGEVIVSSSTYFVSSLIRYDGVIFRNGEKVKILDEEVISEVVETDIRRWNEAFVDGVREMGEDLYRQLVEEQESFLSKK
jgi:hypothetical protein